MTVTSRLIEEADLQTAGFVNLSNQWASDRSIKKTITGTKTYDPPSLSSGSSVTTTVTVTGAVDGDRVTGVSLSGGGFGSLLHSAHVSAADTVTVVLVNMSGSTVDLSSGTLTVDVSKSVQ